MSVISIFHRRKTVSDGCHIVAPIHRFNRPLDLLFKIGVEVACDLVQCKEVCVLESGTSKRDPLLPTKEPNAIVAQLGIISIRESRKNSSTFVISQTFSTSS
jgi:hypothetical protein